MTNPKSPLNKAQNIPPPLNNGGKQNKTFGNELHKENRDINFVCIQLDR
jgi:hypothetical protein